MFIATFANQHGFAEVRWMDILCSCTKPLYLDSISSNNSVLWIWNKLYMLKINSLCAPLVRASPTLRPGKNIKNWGINFPTSNANHAFLRWTLGHKALRTETSMCAAESHVLRSNPFSFAVHVEWPSFFSMSFSFMFCNWNMIKKAS